MGFGKRRIGKQKHAVTEIVGTMLLLGISISLFSVVYYSVLTVPEPVNTPAAQIIGQLDVENSQIEFIHLGGEPISGDATILINKGSIQSQKMISSYVGDSWEMGEKIIIPVYNINDTYLDAMIIDQDSNSIISNAVLQKGFSQSEPYVETYIAQGITKHEASLVLNYDFVKSSGVVYFSYRDAGSSDPWINTTASTQSGYGSLMDTITGLSIYHNYEFRAVMQYDSIFVYGETKEFTTSSISLLTSVDAIPNTISASEANFNISATGDVDLDNVTLYYRYSTDGGSTWVPEDEGNWWDTDWSHRKMFTIQGSSAGAVTNYPIPITVHYGNGIDSARHVYMNSTGQNDFDDIRFISESGSELSYYLEQKSNGNKALFWVNIDSIPAFPQNISYYMYYNNSGVTSNSDGIGVFSSFEGFETEPFIFDTEGEHGIDLAQQSSDAKQGNFCAKHTDSSEEYRIQMQNDQEFNAQNFEFGGWVQITSGWSGNGGLGPSIAFCSNPNTNEGYQVIIDARDSDSPQVRKDTDHNNNNRKDGDYQVANNQWYFISGTILNNKITGHLYTEDEYYGGTPHTTTQLNSNTYTTGYHGLFVYGTDHQLWDAVRVRTLVDPEPQIISWENTGGDGWSKFDTDEDSLWYWDFYFGDLSADFEFISIGQYDNTKESWPEGADQSCTFVAD